MYEVVPPKLNRDTSVLSFFLNRRTVLIGLGLVATYILWTTPTIKEADTKIVLELFLVVSLGVMILDFYGLPIHRLIGYAFAYFSRKRESKVLFAKDVAAGTVVGIYGFSWVYELQPVNLSMAGVEDVQGFKRGMQQAFFGLQTQIQILSVQELRDVDQNSEVEYRRANKLKGKLRDAALTYAKAYSQIGNTMYRSFYLVVSYKVRSKQEAEKRLIEAESSFLALLSQAGVKLRKLDTDEILALKNTFTI